MLYFQMAKFAQRCLSRFSELTKELELSLGPGTADLGIRIGLHSGPVTAGVLRGEKARFQLFGDTMNTGKSVALRIYYYKMILGLCMQVTFLRDWGSTTRSHISSLVQCPLLFDSVAYGKYINQEHDTGDCRHGSIAQRVWKRSYSHCKGRASKSQREGILAGKNH